MTSSARQFPQFPISRPNWQDALKTVLYDHLQTAMILEMYTIPMYLTAGYSIRDENNEARKTILKIAKDEMLHLGLAGNILCAIGGTPRLYSNTPEFPSELFNTQLKLTMKPATRETIKLFVDIEAPEQPSLYAPIHSLLLTYKSIGEFYDGLQILLLQADGILNFLGAPLFLTTTLPKQLDHTAFKGLFHINDPRSALRALKIIVEQGEGSSFQSDQSHWAFFKKIYDNYNLVFYDVVENIDSKDYKDTARFRFYPVMVASDAAYSFLFMTLEKLWQITDADIRSQLVSKNLRGSMGPVIGGLSKFLVKQAIPGSNPIKYAGPPFRRHNFNGNPLTELRSWMSQALAAYPDDTDVQTAKSKVDEFIDLSA